MKLHKYFQDLLVPKTERRSLDIKKYTFSNMIWCLGEEDKANTKMHLLKILKTLSKILANQDTKAIIVGSSVRDHHQQFAIVFIKENSK